MLVDQGLGIGRAGIVQLDDVQVVVVVPCLDRSDANDHLCSIGVDRVTTTGEGT